jgi:non-homologous end joining protein Ku
MGQIKWRWEKKWGWPTLESAKGPFAHLLTSGSANGHEDQKDMLDLARHIVKQKAGQFEPGKFEDHYEAALSELLAKKQKGVLLPAAKKQAPSKESA